MDVAEVDARLMRIDAGKKAVGRLEKVLKEFGIVSPDLTNRTNWDRVKLFTFLYRFSVEKDHGI